MPCWGNYPLLVRVEITGVFLVPGAEDVVAVCDYGGPVLAAVASGRVWATQFHPEKSGATGLALLANFVAAVG